MSGSGQEERSPGRAADAEAQMRRHRLVRGPTSCHCSSSIWLEFRVQGRVTNREADKVTGTSPERAEKCHWTREVLVREGHNRSTF